MTTFSKMSDVAYMPLVFKNVFVLHVNICWVLAHDHTAEKIPKSKIRLDL